MGQFTISMVIFHSYVSHYQRVSGTYQQKYGCHQPILSQSGVWSCKFTPTHRWSATTAVSSSARHVDQAGGETQNVLDQPEEHSWDALRNNPPSVSYWCLVGNGWVAGGMGWLLLVMKWINSSFPAFSTSKKFIPSGRWKKSAINYTLW